MAMMIELGLNKGAMSKNLKLGLGRLGYFGKVGSVPEVMATTDGSAPTLPTTRTLEERRTFLGCFFLTSMSVEAFHHFRLCTMDLCLMSST